MGDLDLLDLLALDPWWLAALAVCAVIGAAVLAAGCVLAAARLVLVLYRGGRRVVRAGLRRYRARRQAHAEHLERLERRFLYGDPPGP